MAAQKGSALLIKRGDAASPEVFTTVAGLRTKTITLARGTVDITNSDSTNKWRELLAGAAIRSCAVSGAGVFKDATGDESLRADFYADVIGNFQILVPDFGTFEGPFQLTSLEYSGEHEGEVAFSLALESAGVVVFTSA